MLPISQNSKSVETVGASSGETAPRAAEKTISTNSTSITSRNTHSTLSPEEYFQKGKGYSNDSNPKYIDYAKAIKYYKLSDEKYYKAQYNLGILYMAGKTSGDSANPDNIDYTKAIKYLTLSSKHGCRRVLYTLGVLYMLGKTSGDSANPDNIDYKKSTFYFRKAYLTPSDSTFKADAISFFNTQLNLPSTNEETRTFLRYLLNIMNNPNFIQDIIAKDPLNDAEIKQVIKNLVCYEVKSSQIHPYLLDILQKKPDYFYVIMSYMSPEEKDAFATYLATSETLSLRFLTMRAIIKDPNTSLYLKLDTAFNLNYELMNLEINENVNHSGMNRDAFCKTKEGFEFYQTYYKIFMPKIRECTRKAIEANSSGIDGIEELKESFILKSKGFEQAYQTYKAASKISN